MKCQFCKNKNVTHCISFTKINSWTTEEDMPDSLNEIEGIYLCKTCWNYTRKEFKDIRKGSIYGARL